MHARPAPGASERGGMRWNGAWLPRAPRIRHLTTWERINAGLEETAIPLIAPALLIGALMGYGTAPAIGY